VYLVEGSEPFLRSEAVRIVREAVGRTATAVQETVVSGDGADVVALLDDLRTPSLFAPRRLVIVEDAESLIQQHGDLLASYASKPAAHATLVLIAEELKPRRKSDPGVEPDSETPESGTRGSGKSKAVSKLLDAVVRVTCSEMRQGDVPAWCVRRAKALGKRMSESVARHLIDLAGSNLGRVDGHIRSLSAYVADRPEILEKDVDDLVGSDHEHQAWEISGSILEGDAATALRAFDRLMREPGEGERFVISALSKRMREVYEVRRLSEAGLPAPEIARRLGRHPYFVKRLLDSTSRVPVSRFPEFFRRLLEADVEVKTLPGRERRWVLERLMLDLCKSFGAPRGSRSAHSGGETPP